MYGRMVYSMEDNKNLLLRKLGSSFGSPVWSRMHLAVYNTHCLTQNIIG